MLIRTLVVSFAAGALLSAASISGTVWDPSGAVVPNAKVTVTDQQGLKNTASTNGVGQFQFPTLVPGKYQMEVACPGFELLLRRNLGLEGTTDLRMELMLRLGRIAETIKVSGHGVARPNFSGQKLRVGGNVQPAKLVKMVRPAYPEDLKAKGVAGLVTLEAVLMMDGTLGSIQSIGAVDPGLAGAAIETVRQWRYQPTLLNGQPVETATTIQLEYELKQ
jgi:TonB family protein